MNGGRRHNEGLVTWLSDVIIEWLTILQWVRGGRKFFITVSRFAILLLLCYYLLTLPILLLLLRYFSITNTITTTNTGIRVHIPNFSRP